VSRSKFDRKPRDFYPTPAHAVTPLLHHLQPRTHFVEPCAGAGDLIRHLEAAGHVCVAAFDIHPLAEGIETRDACFLTRDDLKGCGTVITNPPYEEKAFTAIVDRLALIADEIWLLQPGARLFNHWFGRFVDASTNAVPIGRVKWIEGSENSESRDSMWLRVCPREAAASPLKFHRRAS
jgi:hypothetical protein